MKIHVLFAALALAAAPLQGVGAAEPTTVNLYYIPGNWSASFNGIEASFGTVFTDKATVTSDAYRALLFTDGNPALMLTCGPRTGAVALFQLPRGRGSEREDAGTAVFHGKADLTLPTRERLGSVSVSPAPAKGSKAASIKGVLDLAGFIGANPSFTIEYRHGDDAPVRYAVAPAQMAGGGGTAVPADAAEEFRSACSSIVPGHADAAKESRS